MGVLLYVVHEGSIMQKSLETFQDVFGSEKTYGIYSQSSKELDADFLFAGNIILSRSLELFRKGYTKEKGISRIELNMWEFNQGALAFYESVGFGTFRRYMEINL